MSWNYRVVRTALEAGQVRYAIHEAHYKRRSSKSPHLWTEEPSPVEDYLFPDHDAMTDEAGVKLLRWTLERMLEALDKPIVDGNKYDKKERP